MTNRDKSAVASLRRATGRIDEVLGLGKRTSWLDRPFEIELYTSFAYPVFLIDPPVPTGPGRITVGSPNLGEISFFFRTWDLSPSGPGGTGPASADHFCVRFAPSEIPEGFKLALQEDNFARGFCWDPNWPDLRAIAFDLLKAYVESNKDSVDWAEVQHDQDARYGAVYNEAAGICRSVLQRKGVHEYFQNIATAVNAAAATFVEAGRIDGRQDLLPDIEYLKWYDADWIFPEGPKPFNPVFKNWLFPKNREEPDVNLASVSGNDWDKIVARLNSPVRYEFSQVLLANARAQCDGDVGSPRVAVIDAVIALEIEVRRIMERELAQYGLRKRALDRVVRETPLADLSEVWIRRALASSTLDSAVFERCASAIRVRNDLIHNSRRRVSRQSAINFVGAIEALIEAIRLHSV